MKLPKSVEDSAIIAVPSAVVICLFVRRIELQHKKKNGLEIFKIIVIVN